MVNNKDFNGKEKNLISLFWARYAPYWPYFLISMVVASAAAWYYISITPEKYEATATLLIKDENKGTDDSRMIQSLNLIATKTIVENEIEVIRSRSLMMDVVNNLGLYAQVFEKGNWKEHLLFEKSPVRILSSNPDSISSVASLRFILKDSGIVIEGRRFPTGSWQATPWGYLKFERTPQPYNGNKTYYFSLRQPIEAVQTLSSELEVVAANKLSSVIQLKFRDVDPNRAQVILQELMTAYNKASITDKNSLAGNTLKFIEDRLSVVARELDSVENRLKEYKARKGAVDIGAQGKLFLESVSANDQKLADLNMQLAVLDKVEQYVTSRDQSGSIVPSTLGVSDPVLTRLLEGLHEAELSYVRMRKTVAENNPMLISITDQISRIRPGILENIQSQRSGLIASRTNLATTNAMYTSGLQAIPQKERDLLEISRQQNIESGIYSFLLQKREEAALSYSSIVSDNRVIDNAQSYPHPVSPKKRIVYAGAIMLSVVMVILFLTGRRLFGKVIVNREDIERSVNFPVIGEITHGSKKEALNLMMSRTGIMAEDFRRLRIFLGCKQERSSGRVVMVTSAIPGDGKSFLTLNLGVALAAAGKKVLLVEMDMNNPSLSKKVNVECTQGVGNFLLGAPGVEKESIIFETPVHANLYIAPAGHAAGTQDELFKRQRIEELLNYARASFDYVLIDTAPVFALSDAYEVSPLCDSTFFVVRHGHTPREVLEYLGEISGESSLRNVSVVFNDVKLPGSKTSYGYKYRNRYTAGTKA